MDFDEFQKIALKSVAIGKKQSGALSHRTFGLVGEAGVVANQVKKIIRDKNGKADKSDIEVIKRRLGDTLYYVAVLADYFGLELSDVAAANIKQSSGFQAQHKNTKSLK